MDSFVFWGWTRIQGKEKKKYFADKSLPETCALCNEAQGMLLSAALQAQKESACGVTIEAYSPANQPRTAAETVDQCLFS